MFSHNLRFHITLFIFAVLIKMISAMRYETLLSFFVHAFYVIWTAKDKRKTLINQRVVGTRFW